MKKRGHDEQLNLLATTLYLSFSQMYLLTLRLVSILQRTYGTGLCYAI